MFQKWKINFFLLFSKALSFLKTEEGISPIWTMYNANPIFKYLQFTELLQRFGPIKIMVLSSVQVSSVTQSCLTLCNPMDCSTPGLPFHHQLPEFTQAHVHWVGDAIQPSHSLSSSSPAFNLSQHQGLFQWVSSSHHMTKVLEFQLQHQSLQWIFRTDFL